MEEYKSIRKSRKWADKNLKISKIIESKESKVYILKVGNMKI